MADNRTLFNQALWWPVARGLTHPTELPPETRSAVRCFEPTPLSCRVRVSHNDKLRATIPIDPSLQRGSQQTIPAMKSLIRPHLCLATLLLISTILTGCGGQPQSTTAAARPPSGQTSASRLFGFTAQTMNNPFFIDLEQGLKNVMVLPF